MDNLLAIFLLALNVFQVFSIFQETEFEDSLLVYDKLNKFETVDKPKNFYINTTEKSYAYFDSFDKNAVFLISESDGGVISNKSETITGQFYPIEPNVTYYIRNDFFSKISVYQEYLYPRNLDKEEIIFNDDKEDISFLYLEKNKSYILNFEKNEIKKMIKLSHKTLNSRVIIYIDEIEEAELNKNQPYYQIKEGFNKKIKLEIKEENAFIEFLSERGDYQIYTDINYKSQEVEKNILIINIPKTPRGFQLSLSSEEIFNCSFSYGLSNTSNYYYYSKYNTGINSFFNNNEYTCNINLLEAFKDILLTKNEFVSLAVILERNSEQKIYLKYQQYAIYDGLEIIYDEKMNEQNCTDIIENLKNVFEIYVYTDIAKNPPNITGYPNYHHAPIDIKGELDKVSKVNRNFYEFYQEIQKILTSTNDLHLKIYSYITPQGKLFSKYGACLPFNFEVRKDNEGKFRIFIKKNKYYDYCSDDVKTVIDTHLDIPLKKIDNMDPFDYIQNWSKYRKTKNQHAQFTTIIEGISEFYFYQYPVNSYDLVNIYEFDDNRISKIFYFSIIPTLEEEDNEFDQYFLNIFKNQNSFTKLPSFDIIKEEFLIFKGLKERKKLFKKEIIKWDILYEETNNGNLEYIKCRFDSVNKVNVLIQNTFDLDFLNATEKVLDCARLFYSNEYPLIIIQDHNGGGDLRLSKLMNQIFQIRITNRRYESFRLSDVSKKYYNNISLGSEFVDMETCQVITSFNGLNETIDNYGNIEHKRTKAIDRFPRYIKNALDNFREEYFNSSNIKKPTDIIIFTDSYSYSATSGFIKDFKNTGGAIIVGYYGNPAKNGTDFFDSSQSHSNVQKLEGTEMRNNLDKLGITINGVTCGEFFDDLRDDNPIPREYTIDPIDYRINIYSRYSDDIYQQFIEEGLEVRNMFNNGSYCNGKNKRLLLHDEKCSVINSDIHAHGGFKCNDDNKWDKENCETYFCDIGYYYDRIDKKCKEDCPYDANKKSFLIHEKEYNKTFLIEPKISYRFDILCNDNYYYFFETSDVPGTGLPKLIFIKDNQYFSVFRYEAIELKIRSVNPSINPDIYNYFENIQSFETNEIYFEEGKNMHFIQCLNDSSFYIKNFLNLSKSELKLAKYESNMAYEDIIKVDNKFFIDVSDDILILEKNQLYFIYLDCKKFEEINFYLTSKNDELIPISESKNILFLEKDKEYILDFTNNNITNLMIKLSRKTIKADITLIDKNIKLNSQNLYYLLKENFKEKLKIKIEKANALIEILVKQNKKQIEIIDLNGKSEINIKKEFTFIQIPKNYKSKDLSFRLNKEGKSIIFIYHDYSMEGYSLYYPLNKENEIILNNFTFNISEHYKEDINLMDNEYYYLIIQTNENNSNINISIDLKENYEPSNKDTEPNEPLDEGLELWHIILIIVGSVLVLLLVVVMIIYCIKRKKVTNKTIEEKMQNLTELE